MNAATMVPTHDHGEDFEHDFRCMGDCDRCWGADACSLVGSSCVPCSGCNAYRRWESLFRLTAADSYEGCI